MNQNKEPKSLTFWVVQKSAKLGSSCSHAPPPTSLLSVLRPHASRGSSERERKNPKPEPQPRTQENPSERAETPKPL